MKKYVKTIWEDRKVEYPNRYKDQNGNILILTQEPGEVACEGTPVDGERMNKIEDAIEELSNGGESNNYYTKEEIDKMKKEIDEMIGDATTLLSQYTEGDGVE